MICIKTLGHTRSLLGNAAKMNYVFFCMELESLDFLLLWALVFTQDLSTMTKPELLMHIEQIIATQYDGNRQKFCVAYGLKPPFVSDVLNGRRGFGKKMLTAIGFVEIKSYEVVKQ